MTATGQPLSGTEQMAEGTPAGDGDTDDSEADSHRINARSLEVGRINFRCHKDLLKDVRRRLSGTGKFQQSRYFGYVPLYEPTIASRRERFAAAQEYLKEHPFMRIADYAELTGLSYTTAQRELRLAATLAHSGIAARGRGSHRIYVLA